MESIRKQVQEVPFDDGTPDACEAAIQYLSWALEEIEKRGCQEATRHTLAAITALRKAGSATAAENGRTV